MSSKDVSRRELSDAIDSGDSLKIYRALQKDVMVNFGGLDYGEMVGLIMKTQLAIDKISSVVDEGKSKAEAEIKNMILSMKNDSGVEDQIDQVEWSEEDLEDE